ncbi:hypothetical protein GCK32_012463 [Trichostrongylus colubriformis]|uniref:Abnormal cell migration protein 18-like fibronectin type I domain-containing protein n=1 Tax=Trichostrongylus colubriformis TaxID=6319 RepID=A0AAN8G2A6_TRICO
MEGGNSKLSCSLPSGTAEQLSEKPVKENKTRKMSKITVKLMQLFLLYLCVEDALAVMKCRSGGKEHSNGETWVEGGFKKKCTATTNSWSTKIVACLTDKGTEVNIGKTVTEDGKKYTCEDHGGGKVGMKWKAV